MYVKQTEWEGTARIQLAQNRDH